MKQLAQKVQRRLSQGGFDQTPRSVWTIRKVTVAEMRGRFNCQSDATVIHTLLVSISKYIVSEVTSLKYGATGLILVLIVAEQVAPSDPPIYSVALGMRNPADERNEELLSSEQSPPSYEVAVLME